METCYFDSKCFDGIEALRSYRREWDDEKRCFGEKPVHDWTSHYADAFRYACLVWREEMQPKEPAKPKWPQERTISELIARQTRRRLEGE